MSDFSKGTLLIADPFLKDPNFMRTVVLLCDHREEGSFGFVLNRHVSHTLDEIIPELEGTKKIPVFLGGPVEPDTLHFLHICPDQIPGSIEIYDGIYWGGDFGIVKEMLLKNRLRYNDIRFYIGYSGWGSNQLKEELKTNSWITAMAKRDVIFNHDPEDIWKESLRLLGDEYSQMVNYPIDPQLN